MEHLQLQKQLTEGVKESLSKKEFLYIKKTFKRYRRAYFKNKTTPKMDKTFQTVFINLHQRMGCYCFTDMVDVYHYISK